MAEIRAQRGETYVGYSELAILTCPSCGVLYAIPERMRAQAQEWGGRKQVWHCPNGHEIGGDG